jgi:hypothetical protein
MRVGREIHSNGTVARHLNHEGAQPHAICLKNADFVTFLHPSLPDRRLPANDSARTAFMYGIFRFGGGIRHVRLCIASVIHWDLPFHRAAAALRAISERCSGVSFAMRAFEPSLPPFEPARRKNSRALAGNLDFGI